MAAPVARWVHRLLLFGDRCARLSDRWAARRIYAHTHICEIQLGVPFWKCNGSRVGPRCEPPRGLGGEGSFRAWLPSIRIPETVLMRNGHARAADPFERVRDNGSGIWNDLRKRREKCCRDLKNLVIKDFIIINLFANYKRVICFYVHINI